jgi:carboxylesterase
VSVPTLPSAVLVHGLGGSAATMAPLADALRSGGVAVDALTLPGHGSRPESLRGVGWGAWAAALRTAIERAAQQSGGRGVVVVGQSMGGTLALDAVLSGEPIRAVACINAPVLPADPEALAMVPPDTELIDVGPADIADPDAAEDAYTRLPAGALREMAAGTAAVHARLHEITVPLLVVTSRHDAVVDPWNGDELTRETNGPVTRLTLERSAHVATLDMDRAQLAAAVLELVSAVTSPR